MPIFMDRHEMPDEITAEHIAQMHQEDLKIEHKFNCRGLTYWCDEKRKTAFCLIDAPNKEALKEMHDYAHGDVPHKIIEVDDHIVESFLGRIEDPKKSQNTELNIINDPAFRTIMVTRIKNTLLNNLEGKKLNLGIINNFNKSISKIVFKFNGRIVKQKSDYFLSSFESVTNAVLCSLEVQSKFKHIVNNANIKLNIGLSSGLPVAEKEGIFEDTIKIAEYLSDIAKDQIAVSHEVKDLYESENLNFTIDYKLINTLSPSQEIFLINFMECMENKWNKTDVKVEDFCNHLGYSKSKLYREMISITGKSPNNFIKEYRLNKALKLLNKQKGNISEIAFKTGFNTPGYFSKCFLETYNVLPSTYTKLRTVNS